VKGPHANRVAAEIETAIIDHALEHPCHGAMRVEQELRLEGSPGLLRRRAWRLDADVPP
jgi:hypothetical protein